MFDFGRICHDGVVKFCDPKFELACKPELPILGNIFDLKVKAKQKKQAVVAPRIHQHCMSICRAADQFSSEDLKKIPALRNGKPEDAIVNFYPVDKKGPNYLKYCTGWLSENEKPSNITECIWRYTSDPNWFCTEVNLALAADSTNLKKYSSYIKHLKYSIGMSRMNFTGTVFRGEFCLQ